MDLTQVDDETQDGLTENAQETMDGRQRNQYHFMAKKRQRRPSDDGQEEDQRYAYAAEPAQARKSQRVTGKTYNG